MVICRTLTVDLSAVNKWAKLNNNNINNIIQCQKMWHLFDIKSKKKLIFTKISASVEFQIIEIEIVDIFSCVSMQYYRRTVH